MRVQSSPEGPLMEFANALRSHLETGTWTNPWTTIQLDPDNSNTRYFDDMSRQIERSLSLSPLSASSLSLGPGSKVGSDISGTEVNVTNSFNIGLDGYESEVLREERSRRIINKIEERIGAESFCFLFVKSEQFERRDLASFRDLLWDGGMAELNCGGVLLVDLTTSTRRPDIDWPPTPDVNILLADNYDGESREHAIADVSKFLIGSGLETTETEAKAYSRAMLDSHRSPKSLYAQIAALMVDHSTKIS